MGQFDPSASLLAQHPRPTPQEIQECSTFFTSERMRFIAYAPFYGVLLMNLQAIAAGLECTTASVTYKHLRLHAIEPGRLTDPLTGEPFNGMTFHRLRPMAARTLLVHEMLHLVLEHLDIPSSFNKDIANIAQDAVINRIIAMDQNFDLSAIPAGGVIPTRDANGFSGFTVGTGAKAKTYKIEGFKDMDWVPIYFEVMKQIEEEAKNGGGQGGGGGGGGGQGGGGGGGGGMDQLAQRIKQIAKDLNDQNPLKGDVDYEDEGSTSQEFEQERLKMRAAVVSAVDQAIKSQGYVPAEIQRLVDGLHKGRIKWTDKLRRLLRTHIAHDDFSWRSNSRRAHLGRRSSNGKRQPGFFPRIESETIGAVWMVLDTSGSMGQDEMRAGLSEFKNLRNTTPFDLYFLSCDADSYDVKFYPKHEEPDWKHIIDNYITGGGGTDFRPPFMVVDEWRKSNGNNQAPAMLAYFTDGYGTFPEKEPDYKVFWIATEHSIEAGAFPFGTPIMMKDQEYSA